VWRREVDLRDSDVTKSTTPRGYKDLCGPSVCGLLATELVETSTDKKRALQLYIDTHVEGLKASGRPWFLPGPLGGLGLPPLDDRALPDLKLAAVVLRYLNTKRGTLKRAGASQKFTYPFARWKQGKEDAWSKALGWETYICTNPTFADYAVNEKRPLLEGLEGTQFLYGDVVPELEEIRMDFKSDSNLVAKLRKMANTTKLKPANASNEYKVMWRPVWESERLKIVREEVPEMYSLPDHYSDKEKADSFARRGSQG